MNTVEHLLRARDLISDPKKWGIRAFSKHGKYCALGALMEVNHGDDLSAEYYLYKANEGRSVITVNDWYGHAAIMDLYNKAIKLAMEDDERQGRGHASGSAGRRVEDTPTACQEGRSVSGERKTLQTV